MTLQLKASSFQRIFLATVLFSLQSLFLGNAQGGAIYCSDSNPAITNCDINNNLGEWGGGGIYCDQSSPTITNCMITNNSATDSFLGNGGGIYCYWFSNPTITSCVVADNVGLDGGGGVYCNYSSSPIITNCIIANNSTGQGYDQNGGGVYCDQSSPTITNCMITNNAAYRGGGIFCDSDPTSNNTILWDNTASFSSGNQIYVDMGKTITLNCCNFADGAGDIAGLGTVQENSCIRTDPQFVDAAVGNYRLQSTSPCIDIGNNSYVPAGVTIDLDGNPRMVDGNNDGTPTVDLGAYEYQP